MDAINKAKHEHVKVANRRQPGLHLATWAGGFPGISTLIHYKLAGRNGKARHPPDPEFVEMIADSGAGLYACQASVDLFGLTKDDFIPRCRTSSPSASSTASPPAARSSSPNPMSVASTLPGSHGGERWPRSPRAAVRTARKAPASAQQ